MITREILLTQSTTFGLQDVAEVTELKSQVVKRSIQIAHSLPIKYY